MDNQKVPQEIIDRIAKLMALRDNAGTPAESENAAMRISELLMKWNVELEQLDFNSSKKKKVEQSKVDLNELQSKTEADWVLKLFAAISRYNLCLVIKLNQNKKAYDQGAVAIIGKPHNIEIVIYTVHQLIPKIRYAHKSAWANYHGEEKANTFKRGFLLGCVSGISFKLSEQLKAMQTANTSVTALVQTNSLELQQFINEQYNRLKQGKASSLKSQEGRVQGFNAGTNMGINKGIGNSNSVGQRLLN